ncbi:hypothetical protein B7760_00104 [Burkholderia glumae]|nr:hypothetical protein KS03_1540 [Burkholderia glumae LMG 2196 = ATCC 33617]QKM46119.1 hypothetical protein B7760_00104 [Burkholderia glumae]QKM53514.1 hypothetical protein CG017_01527 [Burkholderia glumae]QTP31744.1 hypothetical protein B7759_00299 [Burkholderia glumae]
MTTALRPAAPPRALFRTRAALRRLRPLAFAYLEGRLLGA